MINEAEKALGYTFKDKSLLKRALTLASASEDNNQRLEFFGDAIIEFIVSEKIFSEGGSEGILTERRKTLVSDSALAPVSERLGLDKLLIRGKNDNNNKKAVPSAYEAVVAAIYIDGGIQEAKKFVFDTLDWSNKNTKQDPISQLQQVLQEAKKPLPDYDKGCTNIGTTKCPKFEITINVFGKDFTGVANKKRGYGGAAELAAQKALEYYEANIK